MWEKYTEIYNCVGSLINNDENKKKKWENLTANEVWQNASHQICVTPD